MSERKKKIKAGERTVSIQKKSLISTLKTAKKANVASSSTNEIDVKGSKVASMVKLTKHLRAVTLKSTKFSTKTI